jgi:cytochrome c556
MGKTMMKRIALASAVVLSSLMSVNTMAAADDAAKAIADRRAVFKLLSVANAPLGGMARGGEFNAEAATQAAERVAMLAGMIPALFDANTAGETQPGRYIAADRLWDGKDDFDAKAMDLVNGANAALEILRTQGAAGIRDAVGQIGPKCGACHDVYRIEQ